MNITYIPIGRGFVYLVDHDGSGFLRREPAGCFSSSRQAGNLQHRRGSQFTVSAFTAVLASNAIAISMDGKGAWRDNVFIARLWRSVKYEELTKAVSEAQNSIGRYLVLEGCGRREHGRK